jgi:hypothetical protein
LGRLELFFELVDPFLQTFDLALLKVLSNPIVIQHLRPSMSLRVTVVDRDAW